MNISPQMKRRLLIFGGGAWIGAILSFFLLRFALPKISEQEPTYYSVVLTKCDLKAGDLFTEPCADVRRVPEQYLPPQVLRLEDLDWHLGHKLKIDVKAGSALRTVDFEPITSEGYIR